MNPNAGIAYLESLPLWSGTADFNLTTPTRLHALLGNPQDLVPAIHVAGTNGKGSVCTLISAMLFANGQKVGQFASPYLSHITERCLINGRPIDPESLGTAVEKIVGLAKENGLNPSLFEVVTAVSFSEFARRQLDWMLIEVGLGGRLDATNTMKAPKATVITSIGFDHMHILGHTLGEIAAEKAGILRRGVPIFVGLVENEAREVIAEKAESLDAPAYFLDEEPEAEEPISDHNPFLCENARLAKMVGEYLELSPITINTGIERAYWPGRFEYLEETSSGKKLSYLLDVAHNTSGLKALTTHLKNFLKKENHFKEVHFLLSVLETKDWEGMAEILLQFESSSEVPSSFTFTRSRHHRSRKPEDLKKLFSQANTVSESAVALQHIQNESTNETLIVITGSIFLVGELRPEITTKEFLTYLSPA